MNLKKLFRYLLYIFLTYCLLHILVYTFQSKFIFLEKSLHADHNFNFPGTVEEIYLVHENGDSINALYFKTKDSIRGELLYFHGNSKNLEYWGNEAVPFTNQGYNVLMIDYRGYGKSDGKPSEANLFEDGQLAYDWITKKANPQWLVIYGRSLGSGIASFVAGNNEANMLILETPFNNMKDVVQVRYPFLFLKLPFRHRFPNDEHIGRVNYPIHIFHGTNDKVVPFKCAEKLKPLLKTSDHFYTIEKGGHKNLSEFPAFNKKLNQIL